MNARRVRTERGVPILCVGVAISILLLVSSHVTRGIFQAILFLIGMALLWYVSHPLGHYAFAKACRVRTEYFYIGKTELRKVKSPFSTFFAKYFVTLGTKLDSKTFLQRRALSRAAILGSGAILSTIASLVVLLSAFASGFGVPALVLGGIFFLGNLATEILFGTKAGDLGKMRKELHKKS